jgi:hypothetical protein
MYVLLYVFVMAAFRFSKAAEGSGFGLISVIISRYLPVRIAEEDPPPQRNSALGIFLLDNMAL